MGSRPSSKLVLYVFVPLSPPSRLISASLYQLKERFAKRTEAKEDEAEAKEVGTTEDVDKLSRRQVKVTKEHNAECQRLLKLMGIPCIIVRLFRILPSIAFIVTSTCSDFLVLTLFKAPSEAEAQCAELARGRKVGPDIRIIDRSNRLLIN
jgi:5'-3' exonuclease